MTREEILSYLNTNTIVFLATVENGAPRVRGMSLYRADDQGILFHTGEFKDIPSQLRSCPLAELCAFDMNTGTQIRVRGPVEFVDDQALKEEIVEARPFLNPFLDAKGHESLVLFRITDCQATTWTMADNLETKKFIKL